MSTLWRHAWGSARDVVGLGGFSCAVGLCVLVALGVVVSPGEVVFFGWFGQSLLLLSSSMEV